MGILMTAKGIGNMSVLGADGGTNNLTKELKALKKNYIFEKHLIFFHL